ncbi:MAG: phosphotransferase [Proteobacteria bacterium]|nr:phosphotransferase [Pseudomonadota bacterium]
MVSAAAVAAFLQRHGWSAADRAPLPGDASARRYERLVLGGRRALLMLTPQDDTAADFIAIAGLLAGLKLSVPQILAAAPDQGLLLVEDFGDGTYTALLDGGAPMLPLYQLAMDALIHLHRGFAVKPGMAPARNLPVFDAARFLQQSMLFCESFLPGAAGPVEGAVTEAFSQAWRIALGRAMAVPQSLLLRDFHAGNLFHLADRPAVQACGLIDFQDAGIGPVTYDLVSLLQDARRDIPDEVTAACLAQYRAAFPDIDRAAFETSLAVMAAQRHVRVIAVFSRLAQQGKPGYMAHLPRSWRLLARALRHPALAPLAAWLEANVPRPARS